MKSNYFSVMIVTEERYNYLTIIRQYRDREKSATMVDCLCDCGNIKLGLIRSNVVSGSTKSCGCMRIQLMSEASKTHGNYKHPLYKVHKNMVFRCYNENHKSYENYMKRGIKVCDRWLEPDGEGFLNFIEDMGEQPEGMSLDRIDVNGDYEPGNCRWASKSIQAFNIRLRKDNKTGHRGVYKSSCGKKWISTIRVNSKSKHLGTFETLELAIQARKDAEMEYFGECKSAFESTQLHELRTELDNLFGDENE